MQQSVIKTMNFAAYSFIDSKYKFVTYGKEKRIQKEPRAWVIETDDLE